MVIESYFNEIILNYYILIIFFLAIEEIVPMIKSKSIPMKYYSFGSLKQSNIPSLQMDELIKDCSTKEPVNLEKGNFNDKLYYIYTSGTTGMPKAVVIRHFRYFWMGISVRKTLGFTKNDILYLSLPLYHNNAGTIGTAQSVLFGTSIVIREKFSASHFWDDCIRYKCTVRLSLIKMLLLKILFINLIVY